MKRSRVESPGGILGEKLLPWLLETFKKSRASNQPKDRGHLRWIDELAADIQCLCLYGARMGRVVPSCGGHWGTRCQLIAFRYLEQATACPPFEVDHLPS